MKKDEIERSYHRGTEGLPMVNVKVYAEETVAMVASVDGEFPGFDAWYTANENVYAWNGDWFYAACESEWEYMRDFSAEIFGQSVNIWSAGRSGGWAVVDGLDPVESWDAIAVSRWARFARFARAVADGIPEQRLWLIAANVYEPERAEIEAGEQVAGDACAEYLRAVGVAS